jgi:hypothetical protein
VTGPLAHLDALERALAASGFPPMTPWWRATITRFYSSGRRQCVLRVGRRGGKSSTLARVAVLEALYGDHVIPPGDVGIVGVVSVSRDEANQRLRTIKAILDALRVKYRPVEGGIELTGRPVVVKIFAASISGVVGGTWICAIADEVARWRDSETGANPATEVLASLRPTLAGQAHAKIFLSSSPLGLEDAHATAFDAGDTEFQCVASAATWEARPSLTEPETHALEPDLRVWRREYGAIPQAGALAAFDPVHIDRAIGGPVPADYLRCASAMLLDPTAGSSDTYAYGLARWRIAPTSARYRTRRTYVNAAAKWIDLIERDERGEPIPNPEWIDARASILEVQFVGGIDQAMRRGITSDQIVAMLAKTYRNFDAVAVHSDQFERFALASAIGRFGIPFFAHSWTASLKERAVERVRRWLADGMIVLPKHDALRSQLHAFQEVISPSGALTFRGRRGGKDDFAMLVMLGALVDCEGQLSGSPIASRVRYALEGLPHY